MAGRFKILFLTKDLALTPNSIAFSNDLVKLTCPLQACE